MRLADEDSNTGLGIDESHNSEHNEEDNDGKSAVDLINELEALCKQTALYQCGGETLVPEGGGIPIFFAGQIGATVLLQEDIDLLNEGLFPALGLDTP